ncbi:acyl carrier protein [Nocardia tengchongensis]|uniref:acyl carrier protein n=1 Tax=Nocardia tengchongensis TaxID=2055889 RepID=UPI003688B893
MSIVRDLLAEITRMPDFVSEVNSSENLVFAGVNSGDLIRLIAEIEKRYRTAIPADRVETLATISDFEALIVSLEKGHDSQCG